jgi:eukaryotic-like serine/threonine-protein kinase
VEGRQVLGGRYTLLNELGSGGTAVVWHARDEVLDRPVAVKVLAARYAGDPDSRARIRDEARAAANLLHPHIAQVYDFGEATVDGIPLPYVVICGEVAAALGYAHSVGLVHRDVKMANVMVAKSGAKVVDFGIAAAIGPAVFEDIVVGTPDYLAPERLTGDAVVPASDVYALGVVLYRLLAGYPPWSVETTTQMLKAHVYVEPAPLPALPGVPPAVADLIGRCLRKDPASRPTATEVSSALADAAEASPDTQDVRREAALHRAPAVPASASGMPALASAEASSLETGTWAFVRGGPAGAAPPAPPGWVPHQRRADGRSTGAQRNTVQRVGAPERRTGARPTGAQRNTVPRIGAAAANGRAVGAPVGSVAIAPPRTAGPRPSGAVANGAPRVRSRSRRRLLAGGCLAAVIVAAIAGFVISNGQWPGRPSASATAGGDVSVAPTVTASGWSVPTATSQPALPVIPSSGSPSPTGSLRTSRHPAATTPDQPGKADPTTSAPTVFDPPPLDPPPIGTRLTLTGGIVYATCAADEVTLTGWEAAAGFTVDGVDPGPAAMAMITFAGSDARYQATVTCVDGAPTSVVVPV